jgi:hypothetical protein
LTEAGASTGYQLQKIWPKLACNSEERRRLGRPRPTLTPRRPELLSILPHDCGGWLKANADGATVVDKGTLGSYSPDDILGGQYWRHPAHQLETHPRPVLNLYRLRPCDFLSMIREIDIWRAAQLMLKRYGERKRSRKALPVPRSSRPPGIMRGWRPGIGSPTPSLNSLTKPRPDQFTNFLDE